MSGIDGVSSFGTGSTQPAASNDASTSKNSSFIDVFKDYFKNIKSGKNSYHDVTVSEVHDAASEVYKRLIDSGAKVVDYNKDTRIVTFDNGVSFYYKADGQNAELWAHVDNADGTFDSGTIATNGQDGSDYNEVTIISDDNSNEGARENMFSQYSSTISDGEQFAYLRESNKTDGNIQVEARISKNLIDE